jgi:hypothetical protein
MKQKHCFIIIGLFIIFKLTASPVQISSGGTSLTIGTAYAVLSGGTTSLGALQFVAGLGNAGQYLKSQGSSSLASWGNSFSGYTAGSGFIYGGSTSSLAATPDHTIIISPTAPSSITSAATDNIAVGHNALNAVASNINCVALGSAALANATGSNNIGIGYKAGNAISSGTDNIAIGVNALLSNQTGNYNVAIGNSALQNSTGSGNVAIGYQALQNYGAGTGNVAIGYQALLSSTSGSNNTAMGYQALSANVSGTDNVALGYQSLISATGSQNVAVGYQSGGTAGTALTSGNNNMYLGYQALPISTTESNNIVLGNSSHAAAYLFGVTGRTSASGVNWQISASSQLGIASSSKRFKEEIKPINTKVLDAFNQLEIIQFNYINDDTKELQYGMIAEDVDLLLPETVIRDQKGEIFTVQYHKYIPLVIKYARDNDIETLRDEINELSAALQEFVS